MNLRYHNIYSDNFTLYVLDLTQIALATKEDKQFQLDYWAKLFQTTTWEELKSMATQNEYFQEACETIFTQSADDLVRKRCLDREAYYVDMKAMQENIDEAREQNTQLKADICNLQKDKDFLTTEIAEKDAALAELRERIAFLEAQNRNN